MWYTKFCVAQKHYLQSQTMTALLPFTKKMKRHRDLGFRHSQTSAPAQFAQLKDVCMHSTASPYLTHLYKPDPSKCSQLLLYWNSLTLTTVYSFLT